MPRLITYTPEFCFAMMRRSVLSTCLLVMLLPQSLAARSDVLVLDQVLYAGMSGFRGHWDQPIMLDSDARLVITDEVVTDRGGTAVWGGAKPGPLAFDAVHRQLMVRFPTAADRIASALSFGREIERVELILPYVDEELWPQGRVDFVSPDGYRYRMNQDVDRLYRNRRPNWHAIAYALRKPWAPDPKIGPTYNAAINGAVYWTRFGASDPEEDRFPEPFGPAEVSSYEPEGRMDITALLTDPAFGESLADRLRVLSDFGLILSKWEVYDMRFFNGIYEYTTASGPRAVIIKPPRLEVTFKPGPSISVGRARTLPVRDLAARFSNNPLGQPTAVLPTPEQLERISARIIARPEWMSAEQYTRVKELLALETGGALKPFYYQKLPSFIINDVLQRVRREKGGAELTPAEADYAVYLAWLDYIHADPPRNWHGHLTIYNAAMNWYAYRDAIPLPVRESIRRSWEAWLMPDRETQMDWRLRRNYEDTSGLLVHPMVDDSRVGRSNSGVSARSGQGDTYYKLTGDWRGNKSFFRSGFTREMSTANFNSTASSGALIGGQMIGSEFAIEDGRYGLMKFPFRMWTHGAGVGQEYIDHYYWAIANAGNKLFADFSEHDEDRMAGWSIMQKTINDLAMGYHPHLKKLVGPAARTGMVHVLGRQDGLYHMLHTLSSTGALNDMRQGELPALANPENTRHHRISAWGHDFPPFDVAIQTLQGPWADTWMNRLVDNKPIPWHAVAEKRNVGQADWVTTYFGQNYGLSSIRGLPQRLHLLGHWRRQARLPQSMRDIGTLDIRMGFNDTLFANDGDGLISAKGLYRSYQDKNTLILLARPGLETMLGRSDIKSIQLTAALFNYEQPSPSWAIYIDQQRVNKLPATARYGQTVTIRDGVTYLAFRPVAGANAGRDVEIRLEEGKQQVPLHYESIAIKPALLINAYVYNRKEPIGRQALIGLNNETMGMIVEMGDEAEYGSFDQFRRQMLAAKVEVGEDFRLSYQRDDKQYTAHWIEFLIDGVNPYRALADSNLWQDTSVSQMGRGRLEKHGAVVERPTTPHNLFLHAFPEEKEYVVMNLLPDYIQFSFSEPGGAKMIADGPLSMGSWSIRNSRDITIRYHPYKGVYLPKWEERQPASLLFVSGTADQPRVRLNDVVITERIRPMTHKGESGWLIPLGDELPSDAEIEALLALPLARFEAEEPWYYQSRD